MLIPLGGTGLVYPLGVCQIGAPFAGVWLMVRISLCLGLGSLSE